MVVQSDGGGRAQESEGLGGACRASGMLGVFGLDIGLM